MRDEYHKLGTMKKQKYRIYPYGKPNKIMPKNIPGSLTPAKDTGGSSQRPILPAYNKKVAGTVSKEFNRGPARSHPGRWARGTKTIAQ